MLVDALEVDLTSGCRFDKTESASESLDNRRRSPVIWKIDGGDLRLQEVSWMAKRLTKAGGRKPLIVLYAGSTGMPLQRR